MHVKQMAPRVRDTVETIMGCKVISCRPDDILRDVWRVLNERGLQRIPVIDGYGLPVGIIYARDALQRLLGESEDEDALLRDYIGNVGYR